MKSEPRTIPAVLDRISAELPDHEAVITDDREITYAELRTEARRAAAAMIDLGVEAGDRVAIWSPNTWHWVVGCLATHYRGPELVTRWARVPRPDTGSPATTRAGLHWPATGFRPRHNR